MPFNFNHLEQYWSEIYYTSQPCWIEYIRHGFIFFFQNPLWLSFKSFFVHITEKIVYYSSAWKFIIYLIVFPLLDDKAISTFIIFFSFSWMLLWWEPLYRLLLNTCIIWCYVKSGAFRITEEHRVVWHDTKRHSTLCFYSHNFLF